MQVGVEECILARDPVLTAVFIQKQLRSASRMNSTVDVPTLRSEIKELRLHAKRVTKIPKFKVGKPAPRPWAAQVHCCPRSGMAPGHVSQTSRADSTRRRALHTLTGGAARTAGDSVGCSAGMGRARQGRAGGATAATWRRKGNRRYTQLLCA